jgi:signal transduction histidine kinase
VGSADTLEIVAADLDRLLQPWGRRGFWQIRIRWAVAGLILAALAAGRALGFEVAVRPVLGVAAAVLLYNLVFILLVAGRGAARFDRGPRPGRVLTTVGMIADYAALLVLLQSTGGVASPAALFSVFHVIVGGIQFSRRFAHALAGGVASGLWLLWLAQLGGWWRPSPVLLRGQAVHAADRPVYLAVWLMFLTLTLLLTAELVGRIMHRFHERAGELVRATRALRASHQQVQHLADERTQLMLQVAHNLRAPLTAGLSLIDLLLEGLTGPLTLEQRQALGRIDGRLRALDRTIGELLAIAKTSDWSRELTDVVVDPAELARHVEGTFGQEAARKDLGFAVVAEEGLPPIDSGADLLERMMENLVSNAIKYTPRGGQVGVELCRVRPDELRIVVRDTGIGIPAGEQSKLFKEFFRASNAKRMTPSGTGLGLTLVRRTVERHRGRIRVCSEVGEGTTFVIDLPLHRGPL